MSTQLEGVEVLHDDGTREKCFVIVGGVHGNEPVGAQAIARVQKLIAEKKWELAGTVFALVGNPRACEKNVRFIDQNLNRLFGVNQERETVELIRAREIEAWLQTVVHDYTDVFLLDLHSISIGDVQVVLYDESVPEIRDFTRSLYRTPLQVGFTAAQMEGVLVSYVSKLGGTGVLIECGNHVSEHGSLVALDHIERSLLAQGMLISKQITFSDAISYEGESRTYSLIAPIVPGPNFVFTVNVHSELLVKAGEMFAKDDAVGEHRASQDSYIMVPSKHPSPDDTDAGFLATRR